MSQTNRQILLVEKPTGKLSQQNFRMAEAAIPEPKDGEVLVRVLYISLDAANRAWMQGATYRAAVEANTDRQSIWKPSEETEASRRTVYVGCGYGIDARCRAGNCNLVLGKPDRSTSTIENENLEDVFSRLQERNLDRSSISQCDPP